MYSGKHEYPLQCTLHCDLSSLCVHVSFASSVFFLLSVGLLFLLTGHNDDDTGRRYPLAARRLLHIPSILHPGRAAASFPNPHTCAGDMPIAFLFLTSPAQPSDRRTRSVVPISHRVRLARDHQKRINLEGQQRLLTTPSRALHAQQRLVTASNEATRWGN